MSTYRRCPECGSVLELEVRRTYTADESGDEEVSYRPVCPLCDWVGVRFGTCRVWLEDDINGKTTRLWEDK